MDSEQELETKLEFYAKLLFKLEKIIEERMKVIDYYKEVREKITSLELQIEGRLPEKDGKEDSEDPQEVFKKFPELSPAEKLREENDLFVEKTFFVFDDIIGKLGNDGAFCVIGGSFALHLHGIELPRRIGDLDLIIYHKSSEDRPNSNPIHQDKLYTDYLDVLKQNDVNNGNHKDIPEDYRRVTKVVRRLDDVEYSLDIIQEHKHAPKSNLLIETADFYINVQGVHEVLQAKLSYRGDIKTKVGTDYVRNRKKDLEDLRDLKNVNFNII